MSTLLTPYLSFDGGKAREAVEFYQRVLGGELKVNTFGEYGAEGTPFADKIMHAQIETPSGFTLMAADTPPDPSYVHRPGNNVTVCLSGDDADELRGWWQGLSDGATVNTPLEKQMWGDEYGALTDRYGVEWMVNITGV